MPEQLQAAEPDPPQLPAGEPPADTPAGGKPKPPKKRKRRSDAGKPRTDKPPKPGREKSGAAKRAEKRSAEADRIEAFFTKVLTLPAGAMMIRGDQWAFEHIAGQGPELAKAIAEECRQNEQLRRYCLQLVEWFGTVTLLGALAAYFLPLLMHFGIVPGAELLGVPVLNPRRRKKSADTGPTPGTEPPFVAADRPPPEPAFTGGEGPDPFAGNGDDPLAAELAADAPPPPVEAV